MNPPILINGAVPRNAFHKYSRGLCERGETQHVHMKKARMRIKQNFAENYTSTIISNSWLPGTANRWKMWNKVSEQRLFFLFIGLVSQTLNQMQRYVQPEPWVTNSQTNPSVVIRDYYCINNIIHFQKYISPEEEMSLANKLNSLFKWTRCYKMYKAHPRFCPPHSQRWWYPVPEHFSSNSLQKQLPAPPPAPDRRWDSKANRIRKQQK